MSVLGEEDAANVKRKWSWLKLEGKVAVKGQELSFHIGDIFKKIDRQGLARCVLCQKDINYSNKGSHALMAHVQTDIHKRKLEVIMSTQSVASHFLPAPASQGQGSMSTSPGPETVRQQVQGKMPVPIVSRIANAEVGLRLLDSTGISFIIHNHTPSLYSLQKKFSEAFDGNLERLFSDLQVDHQWSPDQVNKMQAHLTLQYLNILLHSTNVNGCLTLISRIISFVVHLHLSFTGMTPQGRERKKKICQKLWHEETTTVLELSLYMGVLAILKDYVMLLVTFLARVRKAYTTTAVYLQKKLPLNSPTLIALSALDPLLRGRSQATIQLKRLGGMLSHLLPENQDLQRELVHFNVDLTLPRYKEGDRVVEWWGHVFDQPGKYPTLSALVKCCLSIFHGPRVESSFSLMNEVLDQRSGNMNVETFNAIQTVKYTLLSRGQTAIQMFRREDVKFGEVDRMMSKNISTAAATYRQRL
ncbi:hypothetical protein ACEWY4_014031 [Coilia grayii]|uniref:HAT C-terminal dimerisation domain-containing protein n=1 Tax=Coilia grayii TaxID=363190 RepID=A0ABD1JRA4_9TELE